MENKTTTLPTFLPSFNGFYYSYWSMLIDNDEEREIENINEENNTEYSYDDFTIDYTAMHLELSKRITDGVEGLLKDDYNMVSSIKFQTLVSPREYNFSTDSINCDIEVSTDNVKAIKTYLKENSGEWEEYISNKFTSCSGFYSSHSNDANSIDWDIDYIVSTDPTKIGWVLDFIMQSEEIGEEYQYDTIEFYASEYMVLNKEEE